METVVSDAVGKATPTSVEERTKLNILRGSQSTQATTAPHKHTQCARLRKANKRLSLIYIFLFGSGVLNDNSTWPHLKAWMKLFLYTQCVIGAAAQKEFVGSLKGMTCLPGNATDHISAPSPSLQSCYSAEKSGRINRWAQ